MVRIGRYELGRRVGTGAFATVKVAFDVEEGTEWAMKIVAKSSVESSPTLKARLTYEIRILKLIDHPNVMPLREVLSTPNYYCLIFPLASRDLFARIEEDQHLPVQSARHYFRQLISGVRYLHAHRVVHRDLKPENLLLDENDCLRIADFGLATVMKLDASTGAVKLLDDHCGTPGYMAPELLHRQEYDGRASDMWACGVILFVMLAGRTPREEDLRDLRPAVPEASLPAVALLDRLLDPDPRSRMTADEADEHPWLAQSHDRRPSRKGSIASLT